MSFLGIDVGSVSVKAAWVDENGKLIRSTYRRHFGRPFEAAIELICAELESGFELSNVAFTGSGGRKLADSLGRSFENEIMSQARAARHITPEANAVVCIGGEDSYFILLDNSGKAGTQIRDFAMNGICAAGCGGFLDQQAGRLGVDIETDFGNLAVESTRPSRVAGRCSVFAKTDMIHLQQKATPVRDIVAGLCFAFARNFVAVLARGKEFKAPVAFQGGVALNAGMVKAFREVLGFGEGEFIASENAHVSGAIGAAMLALEKGVSTETLSSEALKALLNEPRAWAANTPLPYPGPPPPSTVFDVPEGSVVDAYMGVDIGSISTNVVLIDSDKRVIFKTYLMTAGRPIEAVRTGIKQAAEKLQGKVTVKGVCTTGSGRYLIGDFLGADVVKNEITAQARAAAEIDPEVDTIFEIGGQDSKYISLENGAIVDFEMNKVCAAGTGSFLEEQAERLGVSIKGEFANLALSAEKPVRLGERCTVFMESDLVGHQAAGASTPDLAAGLAYATVYNYLNRVVGERRIGDHIFFQGGTAFNRAVVSAFREVTGKNVTVPEHHEVTGAIGCCLIAMEHAQPGVPSTFRGWEVSQLEYEQDSFECKACANACEINRVKIEGLPTLVYGGRCEKYEKKRAVDASIPDLFAERNELMFAGYEEPTKQPGKPLVGIPRALHFMEYAPFWLAFFMKLDVPVMLSSPTNKQIMRDGLDAVLAEYCFPVKVAHGHAMELIERGATHLLMPNILQLPRLQDGYEESVQCPYISTLAFTVGAALNPEEKGIKTLHPRVDLSSPSRKAIDMMTTDLADLGVSKTQVGEAFRVGLAAQADFGKKMVERGKQALDSLTNGKHGVVFFGRGYNSCDSSLNLDLPARFRELGVLPIPLDMLPLADKDISEEISGMSWRSGHKILTGAHMVAEDPRLHAVYITNFGCGPDSFLIKFFRSKMGKKSSLQLEIDEHSSDVGALTRCEAFLDSISKSPQVTKNIRKFRPNFGSKDNDRVVYVPMMSNVALSVCAAFRSVGIPSEPLPESDSESVALGRKYCTGKECFPCIVTTGDLVKLVSDPKTDTSKVAYFMPSLSGSGGCRFGCYNLLHRMVLDDLGKSDIPVIVPNQSKGFYDTLGKKAGNAFVRRAWNGMVGIELLEKALHHFRPLEVQQGQTDAMFEEYLDKLCKTIEAGADLLPVMKEAKEAFQTIPISANGHPCVAIVGEVFVRSHGFSNLDLVRKIEEHGGRVWLSPLSEWLTYVNKGQRDNARYDGRWMEYFKVSMVDKTMRADEHRLSSVWEDLLPTAKEPSPEALMEKGENYIDRGFFGEPILSLGKATHAKANGVSGIINVMPFTCMLGTITNGLFRKFQQEEDGMPVLNLAFDGQEVGDMSLRLEAFLAQCRAFSERDN